MTLASFYRHVSITHDEVTALLGGVRLQMVCGDIIHESTDVIINSTNFSNNQSGTIDGFFLNVLIDFKYASTGSQFLCESFKTIAGSFSVTVFKNSTGVSKAIVTAAGPTVQAQLAQGKS